MEAATEHIHHDNAENLTNIVDVIPSNKQLSVFYKMRGNYVNINCQQLKL